MDATLKELTSLVKEVYPDARKKGTHFSFAIVFPDPRGKVYRCVSHYNICLAHGAEHFLYTLVIFCKLYIKTCICPPLQVERYRQHFIWQEGRRRLHDVAVSALPDWRLPGYSYHPPQQSPTHQPTHEALLNINTNT